MELDLSAVLRTAMAEPSTLWHWSPNCSPWSTMKMNKTNAFDSGHCSMDMTFDILRNVAEEQPVTLLIENVPLFFTSDIYKMLSLRMRRWGYREYSGIHDAGDFGGHTGRKRFYGFFTSLPGDFSFEPQSTQKVKLWTVVEKHLNECRDVTHSKALQDGKNLGLLRTITPQTQVCPTITRSQSRMAKDSLVIDFNDRLYFPSEELLKELQGLPASLKLDAVGYEQAVEIIGQSVDGPMHAALLQAIKIHIETSASQLIQ